MAAGKRKIKTVAGAADPLKFIDNVANEVKRQDSHELVTLLQDITGEPPKMWGPSIVGFGTLDYRYATGRDGTICLTGFSPRSSGLVLYLGPGIENGKLMTKLGNTKPARAASTSTSSRTSTARCCAKSSSIASRSCVKTGSAARPQASSEFFPRAGEA